ncbi:cation diffusion facilitator family transporter [Planctomycetota bacterium]
MTAKTVSTETQKSFAYVALLSVGFNVLLVLLKYGLSVLSGSIALRADAIHSLIDVFASLGIFAGIKISERKSSTFPYGLYKVENLASLTTSLFIFFAAYEIVKEIIHADPTAVVSSIPIAVLGLVGIIALMFLFSRFEMKVGKKVGSPSLVADAKHIGTDLLSSVGVLVALLLSLWKPNFDRFVAVIIIILIAKLGWTILADSVKVLLDASIKTEMLDDIRKVFFNFSPVKAVTQLSGRCSGRYKFIEAEITMDIEKLQDAHDIASSIEEEIYDCFSEIDKIIIHYEPADVPKT